MTIAEDLVESVGCLVLLLFHVSMTAFLCCRRQHDSRLCSAFFTLYTIVSIADIMNISAVRIRRDQNGNLIALG